MTEITTSQYKFFQIPHDDEGIRKYVNEYKAFRLMSLKSCPEAFHSKYENEVAFTDEFWHGRLANPGANTFIAVKESGEIDSMTTLLGPLPYGPEELPALGNPWNHLTGQSVLDERNPLHFRLNAVFTAPEARRKGVAQGVIKTAIDWAMSHVPSVRKSDLVISVVVELEVLAAKALYEKCGFVETLRIQKQEKDYAVNVAMLELKPYSAAKTRSISTDHV
jgi:GNAT superfamily N-acetyltransferase